MKKSPPQAPLGFGFRTDPPPLENVKNFRKGGGICREFLWWLFQAVKVLPNPCKSKYPGFFVCVCRTDMGEHVLESSDLRLCFKYPHHGC